MVIICKVCQRIVEKVDPDNLCEQCGGFDKSSVLPNYYNLWEVDEVCKKCACPLHVGHGQELRFCPSCAVEALLLKRGRELLAKLKTVPPAPEKQEPPEKDDGDDEPPFWPEGMPL